MAKGRKRKKDIPAMDVIRPTPEQQDKARYESALMAYRRVPVIDTLAGTGIVTPRQFNGLARYRDIGIKCERSEIMDSCQRLLHIAGGGIEGPSISTIRAMQELRWLEQELGSLLDIARAVCIEDVSLSQWAIEKGGSVMRTREKDGRKVVTWFEPRRKAHDIAKLEIRMAGERLAAAIGA